MRLNQNQNESINSILQHRHLLEKIFFGMHCFVISTGDAESQFDDGTNERYHLLIHHKILGENDHEKQKTKKQYQILLSLRIYHRVFSGKQI